MKKLIKLKDMTVQQWDANRDSLCKLNKGETCNECIFGSINCLDSFFRNSWINNKHMLSDEFLNIEIEINVPVLDEEEKEYLSNIIKPFRSRVISIKKRMIKFGNEEDETFYYIHIKTRSKTGILLEEDVNLPCFNNGMYKEMESNRDYTLEDLGL